MTKICIFGAGAVGGYLAAALSNTDAKVSLIARGEHQKVIQDLKTKFSNERIWFLTLCIMGLHLICLHSTTYPRCTVSLDNYSNNYNLRVYQNKVFNPYLYLVT